MANEQDQLITQLSHISIQSLDDTLSAQLDRTHLVSTQPTSKPTNHTNSEPTTPWPAAVLNRPTTDTPSWQTTSQPPTNIDDQDDWGAAPAYTSLLPYTEFGFTSTMVPSMSSIPSSSTLKKDTLTLDPNQPFYRYSRQPNGFASLNNASSSNQ